MPTLYYGPVVLDTSIFISVSPVLTALFAYLFLQEMEQVNIKVWLAILLVVLRIYLTSV